MTEDEVKQELDALRTCVEALRAAQAGDPYPGAALPRGPLPGAAAVRKHPDTQEDTPVGPTVMEAACE